MMGMIIIGIVAVGIFFSNRYFKSRTEKVERAIRSLKA